MSDRVAVFNQGKVEQMASPTELYERPRTEFVAGFVGISNLLQGTVAQTVTGMERATSIRPEKIHLAPAGTAAPDSAMRADDTVDSVLYLGANTRFDVKLAAGGHLAVVQQNRETHFAPTQGDAVTLWWERRHLQSFGG